MAINCNQQGKKNPASSRLESIKMRKGQILGVAVRCWGPKGQKTSSHFLAQTDP